MLKGIDVSEHNGTINWQKVKNAGINFAIIRLGWIGNKNNHTLDKKFLEYYNGAKSVGLKIGLYVFNYCNNINSVISGAKWTINQLKNYNINLDKPIFIDMEDDTNQTPLLNTYGKDTLTNIAKSFCNEIELNGFISGIYANLDWFTNYLDVTRLTDYKIWLAEWGNDYSKLFKVDMWQYTSDGSVDGINGRVDMNYCLNCENQNIEDITGEQEGSEFDMPKTWKNGSTNETVYADVNCTKEIGLIYPRGEAECYGIKDGKYLVCYNIYNGNNVANRKVGFVKYRGGVK